MLFLWLPKILNDLFVLSLSFNWMIYLFWFNSFSSMEKCKFFLCLFILSELNFSISIIILCYIVGFFSSIIFLNEFISYKKIKNLSQSYSLLFCTLLFAQFNWNVALWKLLVQRIRKGFNYTSTHISVKFGWWRFFK